MTRAGWSRFDAAHGVLGPFSLRRWWTTMNAGAVALVSGLFGPWRTISYFRAGQISDGVLGLPGGIIYSGMVVAFVVLALYGGTHRPRGRALLLAIGLGLAGYTAFWLGGGIVVDPGTGISLTRLTSGSGLLLSFVGSLLALWALATAGRSAVDPQDSERHLFLSDDRGVRSGNLASREAFLDRLEVLSRQGGHDGVPVVVVRLEGLEEVRWRHGPLAADRIAVTMAHRLRAHLRADDTVATLLPGEVFVLLSGVTSEAIATAVIHRLRATLAEPMPSVKKRHMKRLSVVVQLAWAAVTSSRLQIVADEGCLVDAPVLPARLADS